MRFQGRRSRYTSICVIAGMFALLWGCGRPDDYPGIWARPDKGWFSRLGGCPDIRGEYDGANQELVAVLIGFDDIRRRERFVDQRVAVRQAEDGAWIEFEFSVNEAGLEQLEAGDVGHVIHGAYRKIRWVRNGHYQCWDGWLDRNAGGPGQVLIGKDRDGNLIAGAVSTMPNSIGWGDSQRIELPEGSRTLWQRFQRRDLGRNDLLMRHGHVHINRAGWVNRGSLPVTIFSLAVSPVCILLQYQYSPERPTDQFVASSSEECPKPWGELRVGDSRGVQMAFPERPEDTAIYFLRVRPAQAAAGEEVNLLITDARRLPIQKEAPALKLDRSDMHVP